MKLRAFRITVYYIKSSLLLLHGLISGRISQNLVIINCHHVESFNLTAMGSTYLGVLSSS